MSDNEEAVVDISEEPTIGEAGEGTPVEGTETVEEGAKFFGKYDRKKEDEKA